MLAKEFKIRHHYAPSIFKSPISDKTYTNSENGWVEIPADTTLEELRKHWIDTSAKIHNTIYNSLHKEFKIASSKGDKNYTVVLSNGNFSCDCVGYGYRRKCKHIESAKLQAS